MNYSKIISKRILSLCKKRKITINKLASMSNIRQSTVNDIIKGKTKNPKLKTLHKIAIGLCMTPSELLDFPELDEVNFEEDS